MEIIVLTLTAGVLALYFFAFAGDDAVQQKKRNGFSGKTGGTVTGLVRSHLFRNETHGEVPQGVLIGWGVSQGEQYWGGMLKLRIPPWFPCVRFVVDGKEYIKIMGEGNFKEAWKVGQAVTILYDPANPNICMIKEDTSLRIKVRLNLAAGIFCMICCVAGIFLFV